MRDETGEALERSSRKVCTYSFPTVGVQASNRIVAPSAETLPAGAYRPQALSGSLRAAGSPRPGPSPRRRRDGWRRRRRCTSTRSQNAAAPPARGRRQHTPGAHQPARATGSAGDRRQRVVPRHGFESRAVGRRGEYVPGAIPVAGDEIVRLAREDDERAVRDQVRASARILVRTGGRRSHGGRHAIGSLRPSGTRSRAVTSSRRSIRAPDRSPYSRTPPSKRRRRSGGRTCFPGWEGPGPRSRG